MVEKTKEKSKEEIHVVLKQLLFTKRNIKDLEANEEERQIMTKGEERNKRCKEGQDCFPVTTTNGIRCYNQVTSKLNQK